MGRDSREDFQRHYRDYAGKPEAIRRRSENNKARRIYAKAHGEAAIKGKDVHHIKPLDEGGKTVLSNLRAISPSKNRGWKDGV